MPSAQGQVRRAQALMRPVRLQRLDCEGYGVRLRWMDPGIDLCDEDVYKPPSAREARPKSQRSRIALDPGPIPLGLSEVDDILRLIDAFTANTSPGSGGTGDSLLLTCFGVFKGTADHILNEQEPCFTGNSHNDLHWSLDQDANSHGGSVAFESETDQDKTSLAHARQFWWESTNGTVVRNPSPVYIPKLERFLRSSSTTRDALRNALLSISAFYLCNESRSQRREEEAARWSNNAITFQSRAIKLLKGRRRGQRSHAKCPKVQGAASNHVSMVTINVMSGDNATCGIHLDGTLRFLKYAAGWKSKYSPKARSLQRIYFYLRTIYESTLFKAAKGPPSPSDIMTLDDALLVLLEQATNLIKQVTSARHEKLSPSVPAHLAAQCDALEGEIVAGRGAETALSTTFYLRPHVRMVLDSIGAIEQLKSQTSILAAPLYWPAFIAGSEAFDRELQDGFKEWYRQVEFYGIASARTGSEVLSRVWEAGPVTDHHLRTTSHWRMVVERLGSILMLS
ncbi:hypothetical protein MCOR02_012422 [Pyricularia oryzae]|nr:hypothetical protein MCOR02_012422 [Pyricularia oryzae]